mmetsp:Transcript_6629/g.19087  ORF Transcript_6629/g.19087 Transcript_6629/m.19087 type:complete len:217 (-) Transcript_6629:153-803(-)
MCVLLLSSGYLSTMVERGVPSGSSCSSWCCARYSILHLGSILASPDKGLRPPTQSLTRVLFPHPFRPRRAIREERSTVRSTPSKRILDSLYPNFTCSSLIMSLSNDPGSGKFSTTSSSSSTSSTSWASPSYEAFHRFPSWAMTPILSSFFIRDFRCLLALTPFSPACAWRSMYFWRWARFASCCSRWRCCRILFSTRTDSKFVMSPRYVASVFLWK